MAKYKAYPEYKDSGIEWLGDIPEGWTVSKVKYLAPFQVGWTPPTKNDANFIGDNLWVNISDLKDKFISSTAKFISDKAAKEASMDITPKGSLLYSFKLSVGAVSFAGCDLYTNEAIASFLSHAQLPLSYLYYALPIFIIENASTNIYGAKILNQELIKNSFLLAPPHGEAEKVANFLDHEIAKIDNLIEKQQQLIELLKEKRQAVISHAVTKGLNPDVPMKDSGVEWLGDVPEYWRLSSLGYYATLNTGATPDRSNSNYWDGDVHWIKTGEVNYDVIFSSEEKITTSAVKNTSVRISPPGTLLMAMYGQGITRGRVAILGVNATYNQACVAISSGTMMSNAYLRFYFIAGYHAIRDGGNETSQMNLNADLVRKFKVLIPPLPEQNDIVNYLDFELSKIDTILKRADSVITLMQERRTALISAAVTGKIDVRDWVAPEKHEVEEPQETTA
ncbi:restriction endonuclease subunit S [Chimaeribacter coloradensis]|uniref:Restriction endonuclease subunit S n=1 Tax=Chimaeribacter coloradensis TaxID=2060068 RepID=A0A2N5E0P8_9GAMM|nr:restriction endonuclease subunit S [Chimaeribacter coloradensis]PLR33798.1 restriction endonuclease subunit S [Chimaeribacter coloradensis]